MSDLIDRKAILKKIENIRNGVQMMDDTHRASIVMTGMHLCEEAVRIQPSAEPEPLTDEEKRIFLAAMAREEKVCKEADRNYTRAPYEESLMSICKSIKRKVKDALWGT